MQLNIEYLQGLYRSGKCTPRSLIADLLVRCRNEGPAIWIHLLSEQQELEPYLRRLEQSLPEELPLYGIPFAIKDNIDLAGVPTTAACPEFAYIPDKSATVVDLLIRAGAIPLGKTNLDQFATGLVGTRSPYGACANSFHPDYISGGSSSGSAVAVAKGLCTFALGTDTAGSGRVPAAFNNIFGLKPTRGLISTRGVVPACRSLDSVSIFACCAGDAASLLKLTARHDPQDPFSRDLPLSSSGSSESCFVFAVPEVEQLEFFGNHEYAQAFRQTVAILESLGGKAVRIDFAPFAAAARLLYEGPWVAERTAAVGGFLKANPEVGYPLTRRIILDGPEFSAIDCFQAQYQLQALKSQADALLRQVDFFLLPTAGTCYTIQAVQADPLTLNSNLGLYTNFMNLLDYCGLAVPAALTSTVPFGVTLVGPAGHDARLLALGARLHRATGLAMGTGNSLPPAFVDREQSGQVLLAVCGAHLQGLPLHHQLQERAARLQRLTTTAPRYRMYALDSTPPKPGLIRDENKGAAIDVEVYSLSMEALGSFTALIPHPLGIGKLELADGSWVPGFIAEPVTATGREITQFGGWRAFLDAGQVN